MSKKSINPDEELARQEAYPEPLNFEGLERRTNYRIIAYREDILHILDSIHKVSGKIYFRALVAILTL